jgi:O-antigen/teichoic acid export membrane protein
VRKIFLKNLLLLQALNLIIKPAWLLLIDREAQNLLGSSYGEYYLVLNLTLIANIVLDLGIQNFNNTSVAADENFFKNNFKSIFVLKGILSSLYFLLVIGLAMQSSIPLPQDILMVLIANQIISSFVLYLRSNINGLHLYTVDSLLSVSDKFFAILICVFFYKNHQISIFNFVLAQLIASCISFSIALSINIKLWAKINLISQGLTSIKLKSLLVKSLPYALLFTLMNFYTRIDVTMMNAMLKDASFHAGIYAQSFRLLDAAAMFAMLFAGLLLPMFAKMIQDKLDLKPLVNLSANLLLIISITASLACYLFAESILNTLYNFTIEENLIVSTRVFRNIMLAFVPMSLIFVFSTLLTAKKDIWYMNAFALTALITNVAINYLLIPEYQSFGASIGSLITQTVFAILCIWRCMFLFKFKLPVLIILKFLGLTLALIGVYFFIKSLTSIYLILFLFSSAALVFSVLLKLIDMDKLMGFFKKTAQ